MTLHTLALTTPNRRTPTEWTQFTTNTLCFLAFWLTSTASLFGACLGISFCVGEGLFHIFGAVCFASAASQSWCVGDSVDYTASSCISGDEYFGQHLGRWLLYAWIHRWPQSSPLFRSSLHRYLNEQQFVRGWTSPWGAGGHGEASCALELLSAVTFISAEMSPNFHLRSGSSCHLKY